MSASASAAALDIAGTSRRPPALDRVVQPARRLPPDLPPLEPQPPPDEEPEPEEPLEPMLPPEEEPVPA